MNSNKDSLMDKKSILNKFWITLGGALGIIFGFVVIREQVQNPFPQLGVFTKVISVIALGAWGVGITQQCKPTKRALLGGSVFPVLLIAESFLTNGLKPLPPTIIIGWVSAGILAGILVGTAWQGALIGTIITAFVILVVAPLTRGTIGWGWFFIPMGAIAGALAQMAFREIIGKHTVGNKYDVPGWLRKASQRKKDG